MKPLVIEEKEAKTLYKTASKEFKTVLENTFGKEYFLEDITTKIKNFNDILKISGKTLKEILPYKTPKNKQQRSLNALVKIQLITEVLNQETILDFLNTNQYKYLPWFKKVVGSGWVVHSYHSYSVASDAGFGTFYKSEKLALFAGNTFLDIYKDYLPE